MHGKNTVGSQVRPMLEQLEPRLLLDGASGEVAIELFEASPAVFVENQGQWDDESLRYMFQGSGANIAFTDNGPIFQIFKREPIDNTDADGDDDPAGLPMDDPFGEREDFITHSTQFSVHFDGADTVTPVGLNESDSKFNYFIGDQANWQSGVSAYEVVAYENLYDGIDLHTWGRRNSLKYEFYVAPGTDYRAIQVSYEGIEGLYLDDASALHVQTELGELIDDVPYIYQVINGEQVEVAGSFEIIDADSYTFSITDEYEGDIELIIDPYLSWSSYLGGSGLDFGYGIATDASGNAFLTGETRSSDFPTPDGFDQDYNEGAYDVFVAKVGSSGSLLWSSYLGGSDHDCGYGIATDASGNAFLTGNTGSSDFPTPGGFDQYYNGSYDAFVAKVGSSGSLLWSSYLGGSGYDYGSGIATDASGNAFLTGGTGSSDFSTSDGFDQYYNGSGDAFVAKVGSSGSLLWSSFLGGSDSDCGRGIATDAAGNAFLTGETDSVNFPTPDGFDQYHNGSRDAFVAKVGSSGSLLWSSYLGGSGSDSGHGIATDASGNAFLTGYTYSSDFPTSDGFDQYYNGSGDAFVAKVGSSGSLLWSSYLGGSDHDYGEGIATDAAGNAFLTGYTWSSDFPTPGGFDQYFNGRSDAFVAKVGSSSSESLLWSSYLGGSDNEYVHGIATDAYGNAFLMGDTNSSDFPTLGGFDQYYNGNRDAFVAKIYDGFPITGHVTYKDQAGNTKDAAYVLVEVYENETAWPDYKITEGYTDAWGHFGFAHDLNGNPIVNEDIEGPFESGTRDIYFIIKTENEAVKVKADVIDAYPYTFESDTYWDIPEPWFHIGLHFTESSQTPDNASAMGLPGQVKSHRDWLMGITEPAYSREQISLAFPDADWPKHWTFLWWTDVIRIPETWDGKTWETSPDTVAHEYGHGVHWSVRGGSLPTGDVPVGEEDPKDGTPDAGEGDHWTYSESSEGFAFTEGWAEFFQCARYDDASLLYLETNNYWMGADWEKSTGNRSNWDGNTGEIVEGAVASILWDLWDGGSDDEDRVSGRWEDIWTVFRDDLPDSIWNAEGNDDFYHYWVGRYGQTVAVDEIFIDHGIPVRDDAYEGNDTSAQAAILTDTTETYGNLICTDEDWYRFTASGVSSDSSDIQITFNGFRGMLDLLVYDESLSLVDGPPQKMVDGQIVTLTLDFASRSAGTYYVKVEGQRNDSDDGDAVYEGDMSPNYSLVLNVNSTPTAEDDSFSIQEDSGTNDLNVLENDSDPNPGDVLTVASVGSASHGTTSLVGGQVHYAPVDNYYGSDSFTYTVSDGNGGEGSATVNITVTNLNDPPDAVDDLATVAEDSTDNLIDLLVNDTYLPDPPESLTVTAVGAASHGMASLMSGQVRYTPSPGYFGQDAFTYTISDGNGGADSAIVHITVEPTPSLVAGRHVFYNDSYFDGNNASANTSDDNAIATDKQALLPGETATFANYTSYSRGINGVMVDIDGLPPGTPSESDFVFKMGNDNDPGSWATAPVPTSVTVRPGEGDGGSDRVTIIWADNAIQTEWLQVTVLSDANGGSLGLAEDDVFYFGNLRGEIMGNFSVADDDLSIVLSAFGDSVTPGDVSAGDLFGDGSVNDSDLSILLSAFGDSINSITPPGVEPAGASMAMAGAAYDGQDTDLPTPTATKVEMAVLSSEPVEPLVASSFTNTIAGNDLLTSTHAAPLAMEIFEGDTTATRLTDASDETGLGGYEYVAPAKTVGVFVADPAFAEGPDPESVDLLAFDTVAYMSVSNAEATTPDVEAAFRTVSIDSDEESRVSVEDRLLNLESDLATDLLATLDPLVVPA